jgi:hypothetical protein
MASTTPLPPTPIRSSAIRVASSIFDQEIDLASKEGARLYQIGSEALPVSFSGLGKDLRMFVNGLANRAKKCMWSKEIMEIVVQGETLHLLKDYGRIPMSVLKAERAARQGRIVTTQAEARSSIDSAMMFECIENSVDSRVAAKLLKQAPSIDRDGPVMFKQIIENTFVTTTPTTFATKTDLFSLDMKDSKNNVVGFHEDVREMVVSLEAVGHATSDMDLVVSLFMAYEKSDNDLFKLEIRLLKSLYDRGTITSSDQLMEATEAKFDELVKLKKWRAAKPTEDPNLIALTLQVKALTDKLATAGTSSSKSGPNSRRGGTTSGALGGWKYDPSLGSNGTYKRAVEGRDPKMYKWCTGPGHGAKAMWVCGHEPGACVENYDRNASGSTGDAKPATSNSADDPEASIQALRAVLEDNDFGDDPTAQLAACLALFRN